MMENEQADCPYYYNRKLGKRFRKASTVDLTSLNNRSLDLSWLGNNMLEKEIKFD